MILIFNFKIKKVNKIGNYIKHDNFSLEKFAENSQEKKQEIIAEKEIFSLIEEGNMFLSSFKDQDILNELEKQKKNSDEKDSFIPILLNYYNNNSLKNYLNILNDDYKEFQNSLKALIGYKSSFNDPSTNEFFVKFSIMNKIILGKEKM